MIWNWLRPNSDADGREMKSIIIGAAGFVGTYLIDHLQAIGRSVYATKLDWQDFKKADVEVYDLDICDQAAVTDLFREIKPDEVYHLAAASSVAASWHVPDDTIEVNIRGALHVLEAARSCQPMPRTLLVGSSEEYGLTAQTTPVLVESDACQPANPYALTKVAQNSFGRIYASAYGVPVMMVRAFNHAGPGQSEQFVVSEFCKQVALIEAGRQEPIIRVGNLEAERDFSDVRDVVRAYSVVMTSGLRGVTYNVGAGKTVRIRELLDMVLDLSSTQISVQTDKQRFRPVDVPTSRPDITGLHELGWQPLIDLKTTVADTLQWWRRSLIT